MAIPVIEPGEQSKFSCVPALFKQCLQQFAIAPDMVMLNAYYEGGVSCKVERAKNVEFTSFGIY